MNVLAACESRRRSAPRKGTKLANLRPSPSRPDSASSRPPQVAGAEQDAAQAFGVLHGLEHGAQVGTSIDFAERATRRERSRARAVEDDEHVAQALAGGRVDDLDDLAAI